MTAYSRMKCIKMFEFVLLKRKLIIKKLIRIKNHNKYRKIQTTPFREFCYYYNCFFTSCFLLSLSAHEKLNYFLNDKTIWQMSSVTFNSPSWNLSLGDLSVPRLPSCMSLPFLQNLPFSSQENVNVLYSKIATPLWISLDDCSLVPASSMVVHGSLPSEEDIQSLHTHSGYNF